jgi:esterase
LKLNFKKLVNENEGIPIVVLHGLFGSLDNWITIGKRLSEEHTVYLVDQRNHGHSPHDETFNYEAMSEDLQEFLEDQHLDRINLIGHSMGGKAAMLFTLTHPNVIASLCVVDIAPRHYPPHHQDVIAGFHAVQPHTLRSRNEAAARISTVIKNPGVQLFLLKNLQRTADGGFSWKHNLPVIEKNIELVGQRIDSKNNYSGPTLFIRGAKSDYILESDEKEIAALFPKAIVKTIENAGHWVHAEQPAAMLNVLQSFVGNSNE